MAEAVWTGVDADIWAGAMTNDCRADVIPGISLSRTSVKSADSWHHHIDFSVIAQDKEGIVYRCDINGVASGDVNKAIAIAESLNQTPEIAIMLGLMRRIAALEGGAK